MKKKTNKLYVVARKIVDLFDEHQFQIVDPDMIYYEDSYGSDAPDEIFEADDLLQQLKEAVEDYEA